MKIKFLAVGGTIDKVYFDAMSKYEVGDSSIQDILTNARVNIEYEVASLLKKDSLDMTDQDRQTILEAVQKEKAKRIIITHGTDTMVESAQILSLIKDKVIVFTGAMEPAKFKTSDAVFNLGSAVAAVQTLPDGVYLAISGRVFSPDNVRKNRGRKQFEEKM
ncbi:MAG: asparaginase domain-containing protein [Desulfobacula sp.]|nr:asparaginase domain-containing protein [Desulfobacula sp.]